MNKIFFPFNKLFDTLNYHVFNDGNVFEIHLFVLEFIQKKEDFVFYFQTGT